MSDLKHQTLTELHRRKNDCETYIGKLRGKINNEEMRLQWINHYIEQKTPKLPTFKDMRVGQCYRTENGESIYMKISGSSTCNTVAVATGNVFKHNDYYPVRPVELIIGEL